MKSNIHCSLRPFNTFNLNCIAQRISIIENLNNIATLLTYSQSNQPLLVLGEGSNVLFLNDFEGHILINRLKGVKITEKQQDWKLHVAAGENWHDLVCYTLQRGLFGLENLALIPGCVGSAPIQNIGAYGVEFEKFCEYVDVLEMNTQQVLRFSHEQCQFGYRESIFKSQYDARYLIIAVGLRLPKKWSPITNYKELHSLASTDLTPYTLFNKVCEIRRNKLPDPAKTGNAGSFFKNPVVSLKDFTKLQQDYPHIPYYLSGKEHVKLAAGWLIEQCQLKGYQIGNAAVSSQQALVIINTGSAIPEEIITLAHYVWHTVQQKFGVILEPEVRFIQKNGECNSLDYLKNLR